MVGFGVRQSRNCATQIVVNTGSQPAAQTLVYSATTTTEVIPITDFFTSFLDEADCGAVTCLIKENGCGSNYSPDTDTSISMNTGTFAVTLKRNIQAGYGPIVVCVYCLSAGPKA